MPLHARRNVVSLTAAGDPGSLPMSVPSPEPLEKLERPPIVEAVCGVWFEAIPEIDAVLLGAYWDQVRDRFPTHRLLPAIVPAGVLALHADLPPQRVWLCNESNTTIVQVQQDRFYLNWRAGAGTYPRFSPPNGVRDQALGEYDRFSKWIAVRLGRSPIASHVEVTKIDHFEYTSSEDLAQMIPALAPIVRMAQPRQPNLLLKLDDAGEQMRRLSVGTAVRPDGDRIVRMETTSIAPVIGTGLSAAIECANSAVNELFAGCVPSSEREHRFGRVR
jgi:uncharacterized protein (TIGR04255 family)